jgi:peptidoglycan hydrolase-like protein with peptidoglycan-binding domain
VQIDVLFRWSAEFRRLYLSVDLRHQRQSDVEASNIAEAQQLLRQNGFYSGPVDGTMNERTREALRSFQESRQLNVTGKIDTTRLKNLVCLTA